VKSKRFVAVFMILILAAALLPLSAAAKPGPLPNVTGDANIQRLPGAAGTGTLWENGEWDGVAGLTSEEFAAYQLSSRVADDFELDPACQEYAVERVRGQVWTTNSTLDAFVELYADSGGAGPLDPPLYTFDLSSTALIGNSGSYNIYEYTFETPGLTLAAGKYWVSVVGIDYDAQTFFASAGNGAIQLQMGYFKSAFFGYPSWVTTEVMWGQPYDMAFDLDGACTAICEPPTNVAFTWDPASPYMGDLVAFQGTADGTEPITYAWSFGDGTTGSGNPAAHTYLAPICYPVTLTATNDCGTASVQQWVTVQIPDKVLHVHNVDMTGIGLDPFAVRARVQIRDQDEQVVPGAMVFAELLRPMGLIAGQKLTGQTGIAAFKGRSRWGGYWQICVVNVTKSGYFYWPDANEKTCADLIWPVQP